MRALALVTNNNSNHIQLLFDRIIAIVTYDVELSIIFIGDGCNQLVKNKIWKSLPLYGVENLYYFDNKHQEKDILVSSKPISLDKIKKLSTQADIIL